MTPQTLVRIGSVTKSFTGITAALMAHAGDVDLNAPVSRYARGLHQSIGDRSLNALLGHIPSKRIAVVVLSNRNGGIMQRTEQSVLGMLAPVAEPSRTAPAIAKSPLSSAMRESVVGVYVSGADTLRLTVRGDSLVYQFGRETQRAKLADSVTVQVLDAGGAVAQEFAIVRGARSASKYLHDGLSAYRRVQRARTH